MLSTGCSAVGSALALGARGPGFKSRHPDQLLGFPPTRVGGTCGERWKRSRAPYSRISALLRQILATRPKAKTAIRSPQMGRNSGFHMYGNTGGDNIAARRRTMVRPYLARYPCD